MAPEAPEQDLSAILNQTRDGWVEALGGRFVRVTLDEVTLEWTVRPQHCQAYGIVHGGVYCGAIETVASVGGALNALAAGKTTVGLENSTSFLRAVREGTLRATGRPLVRGGRTQVWQGEVTDGGGRVVASGRVRLLNLEPGAKVAGETAGLRQGGPR